MSRGREPRIVDATCHPRRYVGIRVAAEYLGISPPRVHWLIDEGKLIAIEVDSRAGQKTRKVSVASLAAYEELAKTA